MPDLKIPYVNRSYQQIKEYILTRLLGNRDNDGNFIPGAGLTPELTDHSENSILIRIISVWAGITEMINYYIDSAARETLLSVCRRYRSAIMIARFYDYRVKVRAPASVDITFYLSAAHNQDISIAAGIVVKTDTGVKFTTTDILEIPEGQTKGTVKAKQIMAVDYAQLGVSSGSAGQAFALPTTIAYNSLNIRINNINYQGVDTFAFSLATDRHFIETVNESAVPIVKFGDGYMGVIPAAVDTIEFAYQATEGAAGNVSPLTINIIESTLSLPSGITATCNNLNAATGGTNVESLAELKRRIPLHNRVRLAAVTGNDYESFAKTYPSVLNAGAKSVCGAAIQLFIVPEGGGVASSQLTTDVYNYFINGDKKILGRKLDVLPAGQVNFIFNIKVRVKAGYSESGVFAAVKAAIVSLVSPENQPISALVEFSDIYQVIETTEGVVASKIEVMTTRPFARPLGAWQTLDWTPVTKSASNATNRWQIEFINPNEFQIIKNEGFVGSYNVGALVVFDEVQFTINSNYAVGSEFEFYTYPYFGTVQLVEPSVPNTLANDITISTY